MDHPILGEHVAIHDTLNSHGSGGKTKIFQFDFAMTGLVVTQSVIVENFDFENHVVQRWDVVEDERLIVDWVPIVLLNRRSLKAVVMITDEVVLLQLETNERVCLSNEVSVGEISRFFKENCKTADFAFTVAIR
jgi:hypothetical protein